MNDPGDLLVEFLDMCLHDFHGQRFVACPDRFDQVNVGLHGFGQEIKIGKSNKIAKTGFDGREQTDEIIKDRTTGKTLNIPFNEKPKTGAVCPFSGNPAKHVVYIAKSL